MVYISNDEQTFLSKKDERITGKFYKIKANTLYYIRNSLYFSTSVFKRYLYPLDLSNKIIHIQGDNSINYLYLEKGKTYTIFIDDNLIDKIIKLSRKTLDSKIKIKNGNEEFELNKDSMYYKLKERFYGSLTLIIQENDAFIEFLFHIEDTNEYDIISPHTFKNYEINKLNTIITIPYTQKDIEININSDSSFQFSYSFYFSNDKKYYSNSISNIKISSIKNNNKFSNSLKFYGLFRNINLIKDESFFITIKVEKENEQKIYISYEETSQINWILDEVVTENYCKGVIQRIQEILDIYVFSDIAKKPPTIPGIPNYHHRKIDLKKELGKIQTSNRKFYDFYQNIQEVLHTVKDLHFNIMPFSTPNGEPIPQYIVCLPFDLIVKKYNNIFRIFIKKNSYYNEFDSNIKKFIDKHLNLPLKTINDIDPFDYIQNWSIFGDSKNVHAQFTNKIKEISNFNLASFPLNYSDMSLNDYEFEDNQIVRMSYKIKIPNNIKNIQFNQYYLYSFKSIGKIQPIDKIKEKFNIFKGIKNDEIKTNLKSHLQSSLNWDISYDDGENNILKCRVDNINKVNAIYQNSFTLDLYKGLATILKCAKLFYSNDYPIIIIESYNGGGYILLYAVMHQIFQTRILDRTYYSYKITSISEDYYDKKNWYCFEPFNCKNINSFYDIVDTYIDTYGDSSISHKRTNPIDLIPESFRVALKEFREEYQNSNNLKKPTDIIIFTDSFSFSAGSLLIKGFQNTGGAITIGYFGNPKIEGIDLFDASQSPSQVEDIENTPMYYDLYKNYKFLIGGVTTGETYNFYQENTKDQIPMEYSFDPVDYRVDIYSPYSDDIYNDFIQEGLKIHKKFNEDNYCNSKNQKLLLHDEICKNIQGYEHAHGGYKCNNENIWDKTQCYPYYCDIGYYFDQLQKKCIQDCSYNNIKSTFIFEDNYYKEFIIEKDITYYFIFANNDDNNQYEIEIYNQNNIKVDFACLKSDVLPIPKNAYNNYKLIIRSASSSINYSKIQSQSFSHSFISSYPKEEMLIIKSKEESILYLDNIFKNSKVKIKFAKFKNEMSYEDILNINDKFFFDYSDNISVLEKDELYLFYVKFNELDQFHIFVNPYIKEERIDINGYDINFLYLEKDKIYILDFKNNLIKRMIKLSRETIKSEINIENKDIILNSNNLYYKIEDNYLGELKLSVSKENALLEFLFEQPEDDVDILDFEKYEFTLTKTYNIIKIPKDYTSKIINFELIGVGKDSNFSMYLGYTIPPYSYFSSGLDENIYTFERAYKFKITEHYKGNNIKLMDNEFYCVMFKNFDKGLLMSINMIDEKDKNENEGNYGIKSWKIFLIALGYILFLV